MKFISNGVFGMYDVEINSKYHRQRYDALLWQHGRFKNNEDVFSKSEVIGTVASKFGGPQISIEPALDTFKFSSQD